MRPRWWYCSAYSVTPGRSRSVVPVQPVRARRCTLMERPVAKYSSVDLVACSGLGEGLHGFTSSLVRMFACSLDPCSVQRQWTGTDKLHAQGVGIPLWSSPIRRRGHFGRIGDGELVMKCLWAWCAVTRRGRVEAGEPWRKKIRSNYASQHPGADACELLRGRRIISMNAEMTI